MALRREFAERSVRAASTGVPSVEALRLSTLPDDEVVELVQVLDVDLALLRQALDGAKKGL